MEMADKKLRYQMYIPLRTELVNSKKVLQKFSTMKNEEKNQWGEMNHQDIIKQSNTYVSRVLEKEERKGLNLNR